MKLYEQITRMRTLMGLEEKSTLMLVLKESKSDTLLGEIVAIFKKTSGTLTDSEIKYLNELFDEYNYKFGDDIKLEGNVVDDILKRNLSKVLTKTQDDINEMIYKIYNNNVLKIKNLPPIISSIDLFKNELNKIGNQYVDSPISKTTGEFSFGAALDIVYKNEGNINSLDFALQGPFGLKLDEFIDELPDGEIKNWAKNLKNKINFENSNIIPDDIKIEINTTIPSKTTTSSDVVVNDISKKLENLASADQTMRFGSEEMDISVDINNQLQLKELMGDDYNSFINNLPSLDDLENVWIIVQHSDNDLEFQKKMLEVFKTNKDNITKKFPGSENGVKTSIAMLEDRVMVNSNTSVSGIRDTGLSDFGDLANGKQLYGSQGGETLDGNFWIPRPIEMEGEVKFFNTPQELLDDTEFLNKLNVRRFEMGMMPMEDYLKMMNENLPGTSRTINDLDEKIKENYLKFKSKTKLTTFQQRLVNDVEKYLKGENVILSDYFLGSQRAIDKTNTLIGSFLQGYKGGEFTKIIEDILLKMQNGSNIRSVTSNVDNTFPNGLTDDIRTAIESVPELSNFLKNLESGKYKYITDDEEWLPINMLNTNSNDRKTLFRDVLQDVLNQGNYPIKNISEINELTTEETKKIFNDVFKYMKENSDIIKEKLVKDVKRYTKNSLENTARGDAGEDIIAKQFEDLGYEILWRGGKGNALDKTGVDMIVKSPTGKVDVVSVKAISENQYYNFFKTTTSPVTGNEVIKFYLPSGIKLNNGLAAIVDSKNNVIIFPPQGRLDKATNQITYDDTIFRSTPGMTTIENNSLIYNGIKK